MRSITNSQEIERTKDGVLMVWLVVCDFDQFGLETQTVRYGSRDFTLAGNSYAGILAPDGLTLGDISVRPEGGLGSVGGFAIRVLDYGQDSGLMATHVIANDEVVVYCLFVAGGDVDLDRIELARGIIERAPVERGIWNIRAKDGSKQDLIRAIPSALISTVTYPYSYSPGSVLPCAFGALENSPYNVDGLPVVLAPCRFLDRFEEQATAGLEKKSGSTVFQWYENAGRFAILSGATEASNVLTLSDSTRITYSRPSRPKATNNRTTWRYASDLDEDTTVTITSSSTKLHLWMSGCPKLGTLTGLNLIVLADTASGNYDLVINDNTTLLSSNLAVSGNQNISITITNYLDWDFDLFNVEIEGNSGSTTIKEIYLKISFTDELLYDQAEPKIYQAIEGFRDTAAYYQDGTVIVSDGTMLENPVDVLQAILRAKNLHSLPVAKIDTDSFTTARASRTGWKATFFFPLDEQQSEDFIDRFCFQFGLYAWKDAGKWKVAAMDKSRSAAHLFITNYHCPVSGNPERPPWEYELTLTQLDASRIYNEVALKYAKHPASGVYQRAVIASGLYRLSGTCDTTPDTGFGYLDDASATFVTDRVVAATTDKPGEVVYCLGDIEYEVTQVVSETRLKIVPLGSGSVSEQVDVDYYLGPNLSAAAYLSQVAFKTVNALGVRLTSFTKDAGFDCEFIADATTAEAMRDHFLEWFAIPRFALDFELFHDGILVEPGDVFYLDHEEFPEDLRPVAVTTLDEILDDAETSVSCAWESVGVFRAGDVIYVQDAPGDPPEAMLVNSVSYATSTLSVTRGHLNTTATAHANGLPVYLLTVKWIVTAITPPTPGRPIIRVSAEQMPNDYFPVGRIAPNTTPSWLSASALQQMSYGWSTLKNGRVVDTDPHSAVSFVGPDTGTYTIT
jgi:hypothetical protein